jgi:hypothetical protein
VTFFLQFKLSAKPIDGTPGQYYFEYCLDDDIDSGSDYITAPLDPALQDLDPVQTVWLSYYLKNRLVPISESSLAIDEDAFNALASQDNACIKLK